MGLIKEVFWAQISQTIILLCTTVVQILVARFIGAEGLGVTSLIISGANLCLLIIEPNLINAIVRELSLAPSEQERWRFGSTVLGARLLLAFSLGPLIAVGMAVTAEHFRLMVLVGIIGSSIAQALIPNWWLQGIGLSNKSFKIMGVTAVLSGAVSAFFIFWVRQPGIESLCGTLVCIISYGGLWYFSPQSRELTRGLYAKTREYLHFAWKHRSFMLGGVAIYLYLYPTPLLLAYTRGLEESGWYRVAMMPGTAYYSISYAAFNAYYPRVIRAYKESVSAYEKHIRLIVLITLACSIVLICGTFVLPQVLLLLTGKQFVISAALAPALILSRAVGAWALVLRAALLPQRRDKVVFVTFFGVLLAGFAAKMLLIPRFGLVGAAIIEMIQEIAHVAILLGVLIFSSRTTRTATEEA